MLRVPSCMRRCGSPSATCSVTRYRTFSSGSADGGPSS
jgi:hypothetical protein